MRSEHAEVIDHLKYVGRFGSAFRHIMNGRADQITRFDIYTAKAAALFVTWLIKKSAGERHADAPCTLTEATLDEFAERCQWEELANLIHGVRTNPRDAAMSRAKDAHELVREEGFEAAVRTLQNNPLVADGSGVETFRSVMVSEVTDPETYFSDQRPNWLKRIQQQGLEQTKKQIIDAIFGQIAEQGYATAQGIQQEIRKDLTVNYIRGVVKDHLDAWGLEQIDHPDPADRRGNPQAYITDGLEEVVGVESE